MPQQQINQYRAVIAQLNADDLQQQQIRVQAFEQVRKLEPELDAAKRVLDAARNAAINAGLTVEFGNIYRPDRVGVLFDPNRTAEQEAELGRQAFVFQQQILAAAEQANILGQAIYNAQVAQNQAFENQRKISEAREFNADQVRQLQASLPAQGAPASTAEDAEANALANAALIAPAPLPQPNAPAPVLIGASQFDPDLLLFANPGVRNTGIISNPEPVPPDAIEGGDQTPPPGVSAPAPVPVTGGDTGEVPGVTTQPSVTSAEPVTDFVRDPVTGEQVPSDSDQAAEIRAQAASQEQVQVNAPAPVADSTQAEGNAGEAEASAPAAGAPGILDPQQQAANEQAAAKANAINQATLNSVYKKEGSADWRVRLQLAPTSDYLYNANPPGILAPLAATNGVIFPYTPQINTAYKANYEQYDLVHSNYRGVYYKNSRVDDLNIRGTFTAQDTREADYLLAVIHFFRSVTKMFYGKDEQRGSPPPLVYLSGLGMNQFYGHPCVISSFTYNLPDQVDYIRATNYNNYGTDLLSRRTPSQSSGLAGLSASNNRILNAGLERFFPSSKPTPGSVVASVNNTQLANYVPTKMEIDISLIPVQTRSQVSKQFSLKGFANGELIKGGFW